MRTVFADTYYFIALLKFRYHQFIAHLFRNLSDLSVQCCLMDGTLASFPTWICPGCGQLQVMFVRDPGSFSLRGFFVVSHFGSVAAV